jgi:glucose/arabinose dehydrogenase
MKIAMQWRAAVLGVLSLAAAGACGARRNEMLSFTGTADDGRFLQHYEIKPSELPRPGATASANNDQRVVDHPAEARLHLPVGFRISVFAESIGGARWLALAPNGDVFVADSGSGEIGILRGVGPDGRFQQKFTFATGLLQPFGMAFWRNYLYVAQTGEVVRFNYTPGQTKADVKPEHIADLTPFGYNQHWTRDIAFNPAGTKMYVTVGSSNNDSPESDPRRAAISEYNPDGSGQRIFASGLRNAVGIAWEPKTGKLWATVNERDELGDNLPPDYFTSVQDGAFYGWPYAYIGPHPDPRNASKRPDLVQKTITPDVLIQSHSAALGLAFYTGKMFPAEYQGDAFVALHGSWNRAEPTGYKILRVRMKDGKPVGGYDDFITGWFTDGKVWGRPVGLLVAQDGSLLIVDDGGRRIWRVTYEGGGSK